MKVQLIRNILGGFDVLESVNDKLIGIGEFRDEKLYLKDIIQNKTDLVFDEISDIIDYYNSIEE